MENWNQIEASMLVWIQENIRVELEMCRRSKYKSADFTLVDTFFVSNGNAFSIRNNTG